MFRYSEINAPGINVRCKIYYQEETKVEKAVVFCTGFAGHKDNNAASKLAGRLLSEEKGMIVVVFNWPAHGDDLKKILDMDDCDAYLDQVIQRVKTQYGVEHLFCCATSFGGYLLLKYISEHGNPFQKIALRCPAVNMYKVLAHTIMTDEDAEKITKGESVEMGFDRKVIVTPALLDQIKRNDIRLRDYREWADRILILHGTEDEIASFDESREFAGNNRISFIPVPGADHRFLDPSHLDLVISVMADYISR